MSNPIQNLVLSSEQPELRSFHILDLREIASMSVDKSSKDLTFLAKLSLVYRSGVVRTITYEDTDKNSDMVMGTLLVEFENYVFSTVQRF